MADGSSTDERVRGGAARILLNTVTGLVVLGLLGVWAFTGMYTLEPGQAAVLLRLGQYRGVTVTQPGLHWHLPPPIETREVMDIGRIEQVEFGAPGADGVREGAVLEEAAMQTQDNNIVHLGFVVQYKVRDAFEARFRVKDPDVTLRDAAQAAIREVVGRNEIDDVLSEGRGAVELDTLAVLQQILDSYESGIEVTSVQLQEVQPPDGVREAFDDVIAAGQDRARQVQEARGYENEVLPRARAQAREMRAESEAYREATVAEARGEAGRFLAILAEYRLAPEITRKRLYIETMEEVLPNVEKVLIEPGTANVLPFLPLGREASP